MNHIEIKWNRFDYKYRSIVAEAVVHMENVLWHPKFLVNLKAEIERCGMEGELSHWKDAMPVQIYAQLFPMSLNLNTYYTMGSVIGYGTGADNQIYINIKYLATYKIHNLIHLMEIGSNLLHEDSHDKGFAHDYKATDRRPNSLSYILNRVYEQTFREIYNLPAPVYKTPWYIKVWRKLWN